MDEENSRRTSPARRLGRSGLGALAVGAVLVVGQLAAPAEAAPSTVRVCTPKKCIRVPASSYCAPSKKGCKNGYWKPVTGYCSPSVGCVTIAGKNYRWHGSGLEAVNNINPAKCAASLGVSIASFYYGVNVPAVAGVAVSLWGCAP